MSRVMSKENEVLATRGRARHGIGKEDVGVVVGVATEAPLVARLVTIRLIGTQEALPGVIMMK